MEKPRILLIDNNENFLELFCCLPEAEHFDIRTFTSASTALDHLRKETVELVISDVQMPGMTGTELLGAIQDMQPDLPFILITAYGSSQHAISAIKQGAFHYFEKPIDDKLDLFWSTVREAVEKRRMRSEIEILKKEKAMRPNRATAIIGRSAAIEQVLQSIQSVADLPVPVLISGETGTGKDLVAKAIHQQGQRKRSGFFAVNCSGFSSGVLESELFGHEKGAFTGAVEQKKGLFEIADKGTLFLDEISTAPLDLQAKLLRVLETKDFTRVGGSTTISSDFRVIAATNSDLKIDIAEGRFRQDLYYRLHVYGIRIPPLRERKEDIPLIAEYYFRRFCQAFHRSVEGISEKAMAGLISYEWPGNVRELINVLERAVITCRESMITSRDLPFESSSLAGPPSLNLKEMEKHMIGRALKQAGYNKTHAAGQLGISRKTLIEKVRRYDIADRKKPD